MVKKRGLTDTEKDLWQTAMKDVKKLDHSIHKTCKKIENKPVIQPLPKLEDIAEKISEVKKLQTIDRTLLKKIKQGKVQVDARLDLHGMTQDQAYTALRQFISSCHTNGKKILLVITGKGGMDLGENDRPKGILKQNVPKWLQTFSEVLSTTEALKHHGGNGAMYVILRRLR
tara:strand:+ start:42654 stop:43169 length:516 start_codon:yes stop_codon:yes gene_type:complete